VPVLQVFAPALDDAHARLDAMCRAVAAELALPPDGVVATFVPVAATVVPGTDDQTWPVVLIHGSRRDADAMERARQQVVALAGDWSAASGGSWVTWIVTDS